MTKTNFHKKLQFCEGGTILKWFSHRNLSFGLVFIKTFFFFFFFFLRVWFFTRLALFSPCEWFPFINHPLKWFYKNSFFWRVSPLESKPCLTDFHKEITLLEWFYKNSFFRAWGFHSFRACMRFSLFSVDFSKEITRYILVL